MVYGGVTSGPLQVRRQRVETLPLNMLIRKHVDVPGRDYSALLQEWHNELLTS